TGHDGRPHIPGTSLAGALRELVRAHRGQARANALFGCLLTEPDQVPPASRPGQSYRDGAPRRDVRPERDTVDSVPSVWVYGARLAGGTPQPARHLPPSRP